MQIRVNLLPGAQRTQPQATRGTGRQRIAGWLADRWTVGAVATVLLCAATAMHLVLAQRGRAATLATRREQAVADSARHAQALEARRVMVAERDSVERQLRIIRAIDDSRYTWAHILDEVSRALPAYTWIQAIEQTSDAPIPPGADSVAASAAGAAIPASTAGGRTVTTVAEPRRGAARRTGLPIDSASATPPLGFRILGQTVDIQALTLFMRQLEGAPFVQGVTLKRSELVAVDGKDVTEFELDARYEVPPPGIVRTQALIIPVR